MPRYDFRCTKCGLTVEVERSIRDESAPLCCAEGCDGNVTMERLISGSAFHLKGRGWASDGYSKSVLP